MQAASQQTLDELFAEMSSLAQRAGFNLDEVRLSGRPVSGGGVALVSDVRMRSRDALKRLPSPAAVDNLLGA